MLIDEIVAFCHNEWQTKHCLNCKCIKNCKRNCKNCLDDLHYHKNMIRRDYDCDHLLDYYVCRYSYKYCSEIIYALNRVDLTRYPFFHILSLGCGGAADLMAFDYMNLKQKLYYFGVDKNIYWEKIHNEIEKKFLYGSVKFSRSIDVLSHFNHNKIQDCNVLIIGYLISFFYNSLSNDRIIDWFNQLVKQIIAYKCKSSPFLLIINDTDSIKTGRDTFCYFNKLLEQHGFNVNFEYRMRFRNDAYYSNSEQYESYRNVFNIPDNIVDNYCTAIKCSSAQLILEVS